MSRVLEYYPWVQNESDFVHERRVESDPKLLKRTLKNMDTVVKRSDRHRNVQGIPARKMQREEVLQGHPLKVL